MKKLWLVVLVLLTLSCANPKENYTIFLAGDSTMAWKPDNKRPETGWGMELPNYLQENVTVDNRAINGMSTHSFQVEGFWDKLMADVHEGDYVFIQFGHNDTRIDRADRYASLEDYEANLIKFIDEVRAKQATPVLLTSIERCNFNAQGEFSPAHGQYPEVMRTVAEAKRVVLLDINKDSDAWLRQLGAEASKRFFLIAEPNILANYPNGINDNTHLNEQGARAITELIVQEIKDSKLNIKRDLK